MPFNQDISWVVFAVASALLLASSDALTKKAVQKGNIYITGCFRMFWGLVPIVIYYFYTSAPMPSDIRFYELLLIAMPFEIVAYLLLIKALQVSAISVTMPFLSFTPVFLVLWSALFALESVEFLPFVGILLTVAGCYVIFLQSVSRGFLEPFKALLKDKGAIYMLIVSLVYSVTSFIAKDVVTISHPAIAGFAYMFVLFVLTLPLALYHIKVAGLNLPTELKRMFLPGVLDGLSLICGFLAMQMTLVSYFISVKRLSVLFAMLYGFVFFKETDIVSRLLGATLMLAGFVIIVHYG